jgi:gamma-glutamyl hercynylcysteine S-oxide synthase
MTAATPDRRGSGPADPGWQGSDPADPGWQGSDPAAEPGQVRERVAEELRRARARTGRLTDPVDVPDLQRQHSPLMSPLVWDLAHIGVIEELWLLRTLAGREPLLPEQVTQLYDAFRHPRATRPDLPLMDPAESRRYNADVRTRVEDLLDQVAFHGPLAADGFVFAMIAQHEQQHDETMLATHQLRDGPAILDTPGHVPSRTAAVAPPRDVLIPAGPFTMGTSTDPWALDNERPGHTVDLSAFRIDTFPVTNAEYRAFVEDGGYDDPRWWHPEGWRHRQREGLTAPLFWQRDGATWWRRRFGRHEPVPDTEPVVHVCWYEADAYARWAGARLPTEAEWEKAARFDPTTGRSRRNPWGDADPTAEHANLGQRQLHPAPVGTYPRGASPSGAQQLIGDVWEWTSSPFTGYPGFRAWPYREYSEVFFGSEYRVLRGGSFGTDPVAVRGTFRNWDFPIRRQIFSGFRCARDIAPGEG